MESQLVRLNKYISNSGLCTRREADDYIQSGRVFVNNKLAEINTFIVTGNSTDFNFFNQQQNNLVFKKED